VSILRVNIVRADVLLVEQGFFESRAKAQEAIAAGCVTVNGKPLTKASSLIPAGAVIEAREAHPFVSRGALKLQAALDAFDVDPHDLHVLDIGASTGGFSDVLLSRGAAHIIAVDVGHGQFHSRLRRDKRITLFEGTDARALSSDHVPNPVDLIVIDVSFISLRLILPVLLPFLKDNGQLIALIKPQFEAGRAEVKKGIIRNPALHAKIRRELEGFIIDLSFKSSGLIESPILGGDGNREFLIHATRI
jgi:23S rRNA (cytidine1920-2'-O)/16S rRNA (cytidine1409-2'-O)-methyltransferase